jgi:putative adenylate-forming enzyme
MLIRILYYYYRAIFLKTHLNTKKKLISYQNNQFQKLVKNELHKSPFYKEYLDKPLNEWPIINKNIMMEHFDAINTKKIKKDDALNIALKAEETRDFSPLINTISVGLSSGTSGKRGLFLASPRERDAWVGIMLAKLLPDGLKTNERIALFLRANNQLYNSLNKSKKIAFHFFDLLVNFDEHIEKLNQIKPTIISAPSSVLLLLAQERHRLSIHPKKIVAVAEVLEKEDEAVISSAFNLPVSQIYQCTEGFLAISDKKSNKLVMNDEFVIIEKEWLDENRFVPIVTDLVRTTQPIIRYRLDDVLVVNKSEHVFTELVSIEGRLGDVLYGQKGFDSIPIFADTIRQVIASSAVEFEEYQIQQLTLTEFVIKVFPDLEKKSLLTSCLNQIFERKGCQIPTWIWQKYEKKKMSDKRRRIESKLTILPGICDSRSDI